MNGTVSAWRDTFARFLGAIVYGAVRTGQTLNALDRRSGRAVAAARRHSQARFQAWSQPSKRTLRERIKTQRGVSALDAAQIYTRYVNSMVRYTHIPMFRMPSLESYWRRCAPGVQFPGEEWLRQKLTELPKRQRRKITKVIDFRLARMEKRLDKLATKRGLSSRVRRAYNDHAFLRRQMHNLIGVNADIRRDARRNLSAQDIAEAYRRAKAAGREGRQWFMDWRAWRNEKKENKDLLKKRHGRGWRVKARWEQRQTRRTYTMGPGGAGDTRTQKAMAEAERQIREALGKLIDEGRDAPSFVAGMAQRLGLGAGRFLKKEYASLGRSQMSGILAGLPKGAEFYFRHAIRKIAREYGVNVRDLPQKADKRAARTELRNGRLRARLDRIKGRQEARIERRGRPDGVSPRQWLRERVASARARVKTFRQLRNAPQNSQVRGWRNRLSFWRRAGQIVKEKKPEVRRGDFATRRLAWERFQQRRAMANRATVIVYIIRERTGLWKRNQARVERRETRRTSEGKKPKFRIRTQRGADGRPVKVVLDRTGREVGKKSPKTGKVYDIKTGREINIEAGTAPRRGGRTDTPKQTGPGVTGPRGTRVQPGDRTKANGSSTAGKAQASVGQPANGKSGPKASGAREPGMRYRTLRGVLRRPAPAAQRAAAAAGKNGSGRRRLRVVRAAAEPVVTPPKTATAATGTRTSPGKKTPTGPAPTGFTGTVSSPVSAHPPRVGTAAAPAAPASPPGGKPGPAPKAPAGPGRSAPATPSTPGGGGGRSGGAAASGPAGPGGR